MSNIKILVLEDEPALLEGLVTYLNLKGFTADGVSTTNSAELWMQTHVFDILILDLGLGDEDGLEWLKSQPELKQKGLIITTARTGDSDRIAGAIAGADVYLVKPILLEEMVANIHNLMHRLMALKSPSSWQLNTINWTLQSPENKAVKLTRQELLFLSCVAQVPGEIITKKPLIIALGYDPENHDPKRMEILIRRLRAKIKTDLSCEFPLQTVHGQGFAFTAPLKIIN
jgi:DNA-binding response OmpR family regulator